MGNSGSTTCRYSKLLMATSDNRPLIEMSVLAAENPISQQDQPGYPSMESQAGLRHRADVTEKEAGDFSVDTEGTPGEDFIHIDFGVSKPKGGLFNCLGGCLI